jgi:hypothetical protein
MPQHIFLLTAVGVALITGYRLAHRAMSKRAPRPRAEARSREPLDLGKLDWDESIGAYRPRQH